MIARRPSQLRLLHMHFILLFVTWAVGCGRSHPMCVLSGDVLVNEKPAEGVYVVAHQVEKVATANPPASGSARTDEDGNFELQVSEPGQYAITVFWPKKIVDENQTIEGEDQFKGRFRDPKKPVSSVELDEGSNEPTELRLTL